MLDSVDHPVGCWSEALMANVGVRTDNTDWANNTRQTASGKYFIGQWVLKKDSLKNDTRKVGTNENFNNKLH